MSKAGGNLLFFITIMATSVTLGAALAHALELVQKMNLGQHEYFIVQTIYSGWDGLAFVLFVQVLGLAGIMLVHRDDPKVLLPAIFALIFVLAAQAAFWIWTFPANAATENWTIQPENWQQLRIQWEYSHLTGAALQLLAMAALVIAILRRA